MNRQHVSVRVTLTLELDVSAGWGGDCTADQIQKQGILGATDAISKGITVGEGKARIIGDPKVVATIVELKS